jgi:hypothetical protein
VCLESRAATGAPAELALALDDLDHAIAASPSNEVVGRAWRAIVRARRARATSAPDARAKLVAEARRDAVRFDGEKSGLALLVHASLTAAESVDDPRRAIDANRALEDLAATEERLDLSHDPLFEGIRERAASAATAAPEPAPVASPTEAIPRAIRDVLSKAHIGDVLRIRTAAGRTVTGKLWKAVPDDAIAVRLQPGQGTGTIDIPLEGITSVENLVAPEPPAPARSNERRIAGTFDSFDEWANLIELHGNQYFHLDLGILGPQSSVLAKVRALKAGDPVTLVVVKGKVFDIEVRKER